MADDLRAVYTETFCAPPWNEPVARADAYSDRLRADATRRGFTAAVALDGTRALGFVTAWTTPTPFPADRRYPEAAAALGPERTEAWLCGGREVDELAVRPGGQGAGLGAALLDAVAAGAPEGRCWLLTSLRAPRAVAFYERRGWIRAGRPAADDLVVLLGPGHPARARLDPPPAPTA
ncbi:GNAT family N-acetyltransferase [Streptomyces capparidis]